MSWVTGGFTPTDSNSTGMATSPFGANAMTLGMSNQANQKAIAAAQNAMQLQQTQLAGGFGVQEAQINAQPALAATALKSREFGQIFPMVQTEFGTLNSMFGGAGASSGGAAGSTGGGTFGGAGSTAGQPNITASPVYTPQQTQQAVNSARAGNDAATGTQIRSQQQGLAGRGFGSNSPLLQLLMQGSKMAGNQANALSSQSIPFNTAQANAQQLLSGQQAQESQYASRQQEDIARKNAMLQALTGQFQAIAGMV